jgi:hypothetical protein
MPSTPFRCRGLGLVSTTRWVPKVKVIIYIWFILQMLTLGLLLVKASQLLGARNLTPKLHRKATLLHLSKIASLFVRPLAKDQIEAIMELTNQGKEKKGSKIKGHKVSPLRAPIIKATAEN